MKPKKSSFNLAGRSALLPLTLVLCQALPNANAAVGTWANSTTGAGNWSETAKWTGGTIPNAAGDTANFNLDYGTNNKTITIDTTSRTVGILNIGDPGATYRIVTIQSSGGASLIFDNSGSGAQLGKSALANNVIDVISAPVTLTDNLTITTGGTATGGNGVNLQITGAIGETGGARSVTKEGTGGLRLGDASTYTGGTILNAGEIQIGGNTTFAGTVTSLGSGTLTINGGTLSARNGNKRIDNAVTVNADFVLHGTNGGTNVLTLGGTVDLGGGARTLTTPAGASVIAGAVSNGGIIKAGTNPLTLSGASTYTGPTTVNAGTLNLTGSISGSSVTVASGATFTESATGVIDGSAGFTTAGNSTLAGVNTYTGATTVNGGTLTLSNFNSIDFSSGVTVNGAGAKLVVANFGGVLPPVSLIQGEVDGNGFIDSLNVSDAVGNILSAGAGTDTFLEFGSLTFQGAATLNVQGTSDLESRYFVTDELVTSASADVVVNATNTSGVWSSGVDYTVIEFNSYASSVDASHFTLGTVSGLLGSQTAQLVNTGNAIVLRITSDALIWSGDKTADWSTSPVGTPFNWKTSGGSGVEYTNGNSVRFDDFASQFAVNLTSDVSPGSVLVDNTFSDYTISSSGSFGIMTGSLSKAGSGKLILTTNNSFTGETTIFAGILEISGAGSITSSSAIANNGSLILNPAVSANYANPITGSGSVTKQGSGTLTLGGANTFTGDLTLDDGLLNFNSVTALGAGPGIITINGGSLDNTSGGDVIATVNKAQTWNVDLAFAGSNSLDMGSGTVTLGGAGSDLITTVSANTLTIGEIKSASRGFVKQGSGTLVLTSTGTQPNGSNISGVLTVAGGTVQINRTDSTGEAGSGDLLAAGITGSGTITNGAAVLRGVLSNPASGTHDFSGTIANGGTGAMVFVKQGAGTQILSGNNTYTGFTRVEGGTLVLTGSNSMADTTTVAAGLLDVRNSNALGTGNVSVRALGAGVQLQGGITIPNNFITSNDGSGASGFAIANVSGDNTITGTISLTDGAGNTVILSDTGSLTLAGNITNIHATNTRTLFLQGASTADNTVSGVISNGTPATLVTKRESGTWTLSGINTYTGATTVQDGTLAITGSLGNTPVNVSGGTLSLQNASAISQNVVTFTNTGTLAQSVDNAISGTASIVAQKPLTLSVANNYSGDTTINAGTSMPITITHANAAGTGRLTAATGATTPVFNLLLDGGGTIAMPNSFGGNSGVESTINVNNNGSGSNGTIQLGGVGLYGNGTLNVTGGNGYNLSIAGLTNNGGTAGTTVLNPTTANLTLGSYGSSTNSAKILQLGGTSTGNTVTGVISNGSAGTVAVTKTGSSTWTLSGTNTYTGDTTVEAGVLAVSGGNAIPDAGKLVINGGKVAPSGTTESVDSLFFGATQQAAGTWGATGSGATHIDDAHFTGTGVVNVINGTGGGYADWAATNAPEGTANDDYDNDGVSNGVEYVLGGLATTNDAAKLPQVSTSGGNLVFTFHRDQDSKTPDVEVSIEVGTTLATWPSTYTVGNDTAGSSSGVTVTDNLDGTDTITLTVTQAPDAKKFGRLAVTVN